MPTNHILRTHFDFPDKLTIRLYDAYDRELSKSLEDAKKVEGELTGVRQIAIVYQSALKTGLFRNWTSRTLPDPDTDDINEAEVPVILWAGQEMAKWIAERRNLPKAFSWLQRMWLRALWRQSLPLN